MGNKFVKAKCKKTGKYLGMEVKQYSGTWKVVNVIDLTKKEASVVASEVKQPVFSTNDNLLPCLECGNRIVGKCSCSRKKHVCSDKMDYQFDCIYCDELEIDYSVPTRSAVSGDEGKTITLSQGQEVKIRYFDDRPLTQIYVGVGWDPAKKGVNIDVDSSVVLLRNQGLKYDLVYFGELDHPSGCVHHHGDNLVGKKRVGNDNGDAENISIYLDKVPREFDCLAIVLNIYKCDERKQTFGGIDNCYIKLYDPDSKSVLVEYKVTGNYEHDTGLIIGTVFRSGDSWMFKAIGKGSKAISVTDISRECVTLFK